MGPHFDQLGENQEKRWLARGIKKAQQIGRSINDTTRSARRAALAVTLGASALLGAEKAGATDIVALGQSGDNTVSLVDPATGTVIQEVTLSGGSASRAGGIVVSDTLGAVYVVDSGGSSNSLSEYADLTSSARTDYLTLSDDSSGLIEDPDAATLLGITNETAYSVDGLTLSLNGESSAVSGGNFKHMVLVESGQIAVTDYGNDDVLIFDTSSGAPTLTDTWDMGGAGAVGITKDESSGYLIVGGCDDSSINWVNAADGTIEYSMTNPMSGGCPSELVVDSSGQLWVGDQWIAEGDINITIFEDSDGDSFQENAVQTIYTGELWDNAMTKFNNDIIIGSDQTSGEDLTILDSTAYTATEYTISSLTGYAWKVAAGTIPSASTTDADRDGHDAIADGGDDCNDGDGAVYPGATETCGDGTDQDCSSDADDGTTDADGDSFIDEACTGGDDCDDADATANPGGTETAYDGIDQDCDGSDLEDADGDGHDATIVGGDDCDDGNANVNPDEPEICGDGTDNDCMGGDETCPPGDEDGDGVSDGVDECAGSIDYESVDTVGCDDFQRDSDEDGYMDGDDCDPEDDTIHPGAEDECGDGVDADCDTIDPECPPNQDVDGDGHTAEAYGGDDCDDNDPNTHPDAEEILVDGKDQDCDELVDDIANAVVLTGVQGSFSYTVDLDTKQITITPENNTWENGDINGYRIDTSWNVDIMLTGEDGAGYSLGAYGSGWDVQFTGPMRYITTLEPTLSLEKDDVAFGYLNNTGATATVNEDTNEVTADTDGDGQKEILIPAEGSGDDDTGGNVNPPSGPDCGGCSTIKGQPNPGATIAAVGAAILALLRRRSRSDVKKTA